jgi:aminoglycoside phosphotransferase (APT) family kinase protein
MTPVPTASLELACRVLHDARPAAGSHSGETFSGLWFRQRAYVRFYPARPQRAAVDVAIMRRLDGQIPLPRVLTSSPHEADGLPPYVVTEAVSGQRVDDVVRSGMSVAAARALGRQCARVISVLRSQALDHPGPLAGASFAVGEWPRHRRSLRALAAHLEPGLAKAGLSAARQPALRSLLSSADARLSAAGTDDTCLVHADLGSKNLIIDPDTGRLRAVLDWEYAHAGDWCTDLGRLMRGVQRAVDQGPNGDAWASYRQGLVDGVHEDLYESGLLAGGANLDWLGHAADLDLYNLLELAARPGTDAQVTEPVQQARSLLRERAGLTSR